MCYNLISHICVLDLLSAVARLL